LASTLTHGLSSEANALLCIQNRSLGTSSTTPSNFVPVITFFTPTSQTRDLIPRAPPYTWSIVTSPITFAPYSLPGVIVVSDYQSRSAFINKASEGKGRKESDRNTLILPEFFDLLDLAGELLSESLLERLDN
jgi:hypothetical protein